MNPNWKRLWKEIGVFALCVGLYLVLFIVGLNIIVWFIERLVFPHPILDGWCWVFAFPSQVGHQLDPDGPLALTLLALDPFVYGGGFYLAWRMFRLMRFKPRDGDSPE